MLATSLESLLSAIRSTRIGVIGDFCLDAYWILDESSQEVSVETGLPIRSVRAQSYSPGGAGNVLHNLIALGTGSVAGFGVVGSDPFGREMLDILRKLGADVEGMVVLDEGWNTPVYIKPILHDHEENRLDFGGSNRLSQQAGRRLLSCLESALPHLDAIVINQQLTHGIHTTDVQSGLNAILSRAGRTVSIADCRHLADVYENCAHKLNDLEAMKLLGHPRNFREVISANEAAEAGQRLFERWNKPVFITRGDQGILVVDGAVSASVPAVPVAGPVDTVGAGDSAVAGISAALAAGRSPREAAQFGTLVAAVTVRKLLQTGTATPDELREIIQQATEV